MSDKLAIRLTLNPIGVVAPILRTLQETLEVLSISVMAVRNADLSQPLPDIGSRMTMEFRGDSRKPEEKLANYLNWLFSKGFQEYARSVRHALEEAHFFISIVGRARNNQLPNTWGELQEIMGPVRRKSAMMRFPDLMDDTNGCYY